MIFARERAILAFVLYRQADTHGTEQILLPLQLIPPCGRNRANEQQHDELYLERGIAYKVEGRYEEAIAEFRELLNEDPNSSDAHYQLAWSMALPGCSTSRWKSCSTPSPSTRPAPIRANDLALTHSMLGNYEQAKSEFEEVLRRDPNNKRALESLVFFSDPA